MDKSKMAKADTTVNYSMFKGDHGRNKLSHGLKGQCHCQGECWCGESCESTTVDPLGKEDCDCQGLCCCN